MFASTSASTSTRSSIPRVSSPLASQSTTASYDGQSSSDSDEDSQDSDNDENESSDDESSDDDDDDNLEELLQAAKSNARARAAAGASLDMGVDQTGLGDINLADMDDSNNRLAAIFTQPAVASQVFDMTSSSSSNKGKSRQVTTHPDDLPILAGTTDKWGEMPRSKPTKSSKKLSKQGSDVAKGWFDMPRRTLESLSNEEKREIQALRLSNAMDPKRFMRGQSKRENKKMPEYFQMGHIVDSAQGLRAGTQAPSSKPKRSTFMAGLLDDDKGRAYVNRKYAEVQAKASSGGRGYAKQRAKDRKGTFGNKSGRGGKKTRR